jgi:CheY-like chemotaxis protein
VVVDDDRDGAEALGALLTILGLDVRVVLSGLAALELAHAFQPRLVVLDINMPGLDGFETVRRLKQQSWAQIALFVAHTGMQREAADGDMFADFHYVLTKGEGSAALEAIVQKLHASA